MINSENNSTEQLAETIIHAVQDKKAEKVISLDLSKIPNAVCSRFVVCHGNSKTQVDAIADEAIRKVKTETGEKPWHTEGYENAEWILIDYVDVVLHIFRKEVRDFYKLEDLWADVDITRYEE
ncbi:MAG: ribosome silencing factor [Bacteroidales bacterium]|nr:ribosome silencing factor [Bacteroidales bacterium]MCF8388812.1 ribosome silencing factor [Bacteroidales bacterium]MCF8398002.1 ribosome silencing factor [Bacteroidales bacterium]